MRYLYIIVALLITCGCNYNRQPGHGKKPVISFKNIKGLYYTEVRREQNGLAFNEYGYRLLPEWRLRFLSDTSVALFSPVKKKFLNFPLSCGIDSVFNTNSSFLRVSKMSRDSLVFELLTVKDDSLDLKGSKVFMHFYADDYIRNKLHTTMELLQRNTHQDTAFIKGLIRKADMDRSKAFAAFNPVELSSRKPSVKIVKRKNIPDDLINHYNTSDDYMNPVYDIAINKAYANFSYSFSAYVDSAGQLYYNKPLLPLPEGKFRDNYIRLSKAVMNGYLKRYMAVTPGKTLGLAHLSEITLHVSGTTGQ